MPKDKPVKKSALRPHDPLEAVLRNDPTVESEAAAKAARKKRLMKKQGPRNAFGEEEDEDDLGADAAAAEEDDYVPAKVSKKILATARAQQMDDEDDAVDGVKKKRVTFGSAAAAPSAGSGARPGASLLAKAGKLGGFDSDDEDDVEEEEEEEIVFDDADGVGLDGDYVDVRWGDFGMGGGSGGGVGGMPSAEDDAILRRFMPDAPTERRTLADIIMEKLKEKEAEAAAGGGGSGEGEGEEAFDELDPKIVEVYTEVGKYLAHYKSGRLPKVLKVVPALANWEEILFLTNPETWTPHATYAATKIFASNLNPTKAQRYFNLVLLPKCRDDIFRQKRLNFHLYMALRKATYKSAAFYKGIVLPLIASNDVTLREAIIFGSVVAKASIPQLHSAAALIKLAGMHYNGAVSVLLRVLINKKYTLPYMAVDALVAHFLTFKTIPGPLPVLWHQTLLCFVQRYKADLTHSQKEELKSLCALHSHHLITPEVRREMFSVGCRGETPAPPPPLPVVAGPALASAAVAKAPKAAAARAMASGDAMDDY